MIAGLGMIGTGYLLEMAKDWTVFIKIPEFFVLVTSLLGLKNNLEMNLASRLSTQANLGILSGPQKWTVLRGNACLVQVQAVVISFLASLVAIIVGVVSPRGGEPISLENCFLLCATSLVTASVAGFLLTLIVILVELYAGKWNINPDNVVAPISAGVGDVATTYLMARLAKCLYATDVRGDSPWLCPAIILAYFLMAPFWIYWAFRNGFARGTLVSGWVPLLIAMAISSGGGFIFDKSEDEFKQLPLYEPVITGIGGNLAAVMASRVASGLTREAGATPGKVCKSPVEVFLGKGNDATAARVLLLLVGPAYLVFTAITYLLSEEAVWSFGFLGFYLGAALVQVAILLYLAEIMVAFMWSKKVDPDANAFPYLTAIADLIGTGLLYSAFLLTKHYFPGVIKDNDE